MKKPARVFFILLFSSLLCFTGCSPKQNVSDTVQLKIGVMLYKQDDTFISTISGYLQDAAKSREKQARLKITMNVMDGKGNQSIQNEQVEKFLSQNYDVLCVNLVDRAAAAYIVDKAKAADTPVIFFNREPVEEDILRWQKIYYVGSNPSQAGSMQGQIVLQMYGRNPERVDRNQDERLQYVMLEGEQGHQDTTIRTETCIRTLRQARIGVEKLANDTANWQRAQATSKMTQWIAEFGDSIEVVFCNNDDMALGAIDAYNAAGIESLPVIVGVDGTPPALDAIRAGTLSGTVENDAYHQAQAIFELAFVLSTGGDIEAALPNLQGQYIRLPHRILTKDILDIDN